MALFYYAPYPFLTILVKNIDALPCYAITSISMFYVQFPTFPAASLRERIKIISGGAVPKETHHNKSVAERSRSLLLKLFDQFL